MNYVKHFSDFAMLSDIQTLLELEKTKIYLRFDICPLMTSLVRPIPIQADSHPIKRLETPIYFQAVGSGRCACCTMPQMALFGAAFSQLKQNQRNLQILKVVLQKMFQ